MKSEQGTTRVKYWVRWCFVIPFWFVFVWLFDASAAESVILCWLFRLTMEINYE